MRAFEELSKPSYEQFEDKLLQACSTLQGMQMYRSDNCDEDDRNSYIATLLEFGGEYVKDQTKWSVSHKGKKPGEIDVFAKTTDGAPFSIIEGMNLSYVDKNYINIHLSKTFKYDTTGLPNNYIIVYATSKKFLPFCNRYFEYIKERTYQFKLKKIEKIDLGLTELKLFKAYHLRSGETVYLNHIIINLE